MLINKTSTDTIYTLHFDVFSSSHSIMIKSHRQDISDLEVMTYIKNSVYDIRFFSADESLPAEIIVYAQDALSQNNLAPMFRFKSFELPSNAEEVHESTEDLNISEKARAAMFIEWVFINYISNWSTLSYTFGNKV